MQAAKAISSILKPLEILTRSLPYHLQQSLAGGLQNVEGTVDLANMFEDLEHPMFARTTAAARQVAAGALVNMAANSHTPCSAHI